MNIHLKYTILEAISNCPFKNDRDCDSAETGAKNVFSYLKDVLNDEVLLMLLDKCEKDFYKFNRYDPCEPYIRGYLHAVYFVVCMFNLSYREYFQFLSDQKKNITILMRYKIDTDKKYA